MLEHLWSAAGAAAGLLSLLESIMICYLLFVIHRHAGSRLSLLALGSALGVVIVDGGGTFCNWVASLLMQMNLWHSWSLMPIVEASSLVGRVGSLLFVVMALAFLGVAIGARRGKSRVARRGQT